MIRTAPISTAAAAAALACASCAPVEEEPLAVPGLSSERQCFFASEIDGYAEAPDGADGRDRLYITTGVDDRWLFESFGGCPELDWTLQIGLDTRPLTSLCTGDTATLLVPTTLGDRADRCTVRLLGKMEPPD